MQSAHDDAALAPDVARYFPGTHGTHDDAPVTSEYVPQGHSKQIFGALLPGAIEYLPAGQFEQVERPADTPNLPAGQPKHWAAALAPAVSRYLPVSHFVQLSAAVPPSADLHEPAEQF